MTEQNGFAAGVGAGQPDAQQESAEPADVGSADAGWADVGSADAGEDAVEDATVDESDAGSDEARECHEMLLRLAGKAPDGLITRARGWLAAGRRGDLARAFTFWAVSNDVALTEYDTVLLGALMADEAADPSALAHLRVEDAEQLPYYSFAVQVPAGLTVEPVSPPRSRAKSAGNPEEVMTKAIAKEQGARGVWRAWRFPSDGALWPPPKRVWVVEVDDGIHEIDVADRLQKRLAAVGEADPQVEVYQTGYELPVYQEFARAYGELLWAATDDPGIRIATVFDEVHADAGPRFRPDHPLLEEEEAGEVATYLYQGEPLLVTTARMDDVKDSSRSNSVPMSFRTDGTWIWTEASAYYLEHYRLEPDVGLLGHIRANNYKPPAVDGVALYRALQVLQAPADEEPTTNAGDAGKGEPDSPRG